MSAGQPSTKLFDRNAAFLRREFLGRNVFDYENSDLQQKTLCFFDTDLIVTYCEPWLTGPGRDDDGNDYGVIFPPEEIKGDLPKWHLSEKDRATHIAAIIAEYVFREFRPNIIPVYQFDEHFEETKLIYEKNAQYFAKQVMSRPQTIFKAREERMRRAAALLASRAPKKDDSLSLMPEMMALLHSMEPLGFPKDRNKRRLLSWERFIHLNIVTGGIYPAHLAADHFEREEDKHVKDALMILKGEQSPEEEAIFRSLTEEFSKHLANFTESNRERREHDAKAIASLYLLNARLKNVTGWRAIFITGAQGLVEACYGPFPDVEGIDKEISDKFSQKYIRHFWAFTTEALLEPDSEGRRKFINWLDGLLAREAGTTNFKESHLTKLVRNPKVSAFVGNDRGGKSEQDTLKNVLRKWNKLTEKAVIKHRVESLGINSDEAIRLQDRILKRLSQWYDNLENKSWEDLLDLIREEYHRSKDRTFLDFSTFGKDSIFRPPEEIRQRNPPDLAFVSLANTNKIFQRLCDSELYSDQDFTEDFNAIKDDCHDPSEDGDDRQLNHLRFLVLGAVFAAANKWGVGLSQGKRAISIIERSKKLGLWPIPVKPQEPGGPISFMSGREAYFLCAAATRVVARNANDLKSALELLEKSETALKLDKKRESAETVTFVRFKCERLELALAEYYLERKERDHPAATSVETRDQFCDELVPNIYQAARNLLDEIRKEVPSGELVSDKEGFVREKISRLTLVHVATNLIQTCVIRAFRQLNNRVDSGEFPITEADLHQALRLIAYFADPPPDFHEDRLRQTPLIKLYRDAGARILDDEAFSYEPSPEKLDALFEGESNCIVAEYDDWRFEKLKDLGHRLNADPGPERRALLFGGE